MSFVDNYDSDSSEIIYHDHRDDVYNDEGGPFQIPWGDGGLPMPGSFPTPEAVRKEAQDRAEKILDNWAILNWTLERFEATIRKRWLKRTSEKRKDLLRSAWPNMAPSHRPDIAAFAKSLRSTVSREEAYMWPYINLEDLSKPKLMLIFLNSRGRNPPHAFAGADLEASRFGETAGALHPAFLNCYTMMFTGRTTPERYGELISWDDDDRAFDWLHTQRGVHPGHGLFVLQIQERIYEFLLTICTLLLPDHKLAIGSDTASIPIEPEPAIISTQEAGMNLLSAVASEAPYRLPANFDLSRLQGIAAAKRDAAKDHIWSLREDPAYFADYLRDAKQHRSELVPDAHGRQDHLVRTQPRKFWNRVINKVLPDAYLSFCMWDEVHRRLADVQKLLEKYQGALVPEDDLPPDLTLEFCQLVYLLEQITKIVIYDLKCSVPASPALRAFFCREPNEASPDKIICVEKSSFGAEKHQKRLRWILRTLWDEQQRFLVGLHTLMDEFGRLLESEKSVNQLISPWVMNQVSDLSVISELQYQISLFQPWAATFETTTAEKEAEVQDSIKRIMSGWVDLRPTGAIYLADLGDLGDGRFVYPVDKRRTKENTLAMQQAEANLDAFWKKADSLYFKPNGLPKNFALSLLLSNERILQRTPDWVENEPTPKQQQQLTATGNVNISDTISLPLSQLYLELENRTERTVGSNENLGARTRVKAKTRGTPRTVSEKGSQKTSHHGPDLQPTFTVDQRALKVFSTLFYVPSRTSQPGEVSWTDFLHAMRSTGFLIEKLYGSVWQFTPQKLDVERGIQFHEPHPSGKIPFRVARRHGRRLSRAYGWHSGIFKLAA